MSPECMRQVLPQVFKLGRPVIQYAFGDFSNPVAKPWVEFLRRNVIEAKQVTAAKSGKNAADVALVVEAMQLALRGRCDALCIVSSDRDFVALTTFLKAEGIDAYGFGKASTGSKYRQSCAKFFEVSYPPKAQPTNPELSSKTELPTAASTTARQTLNLPVIMQEVARLADKSGWTSLQALGCALGKRGIRAIDNGAKIWAQVFSGLEGFETSKDEKGRRSVRIVARDRGAA
ncbi:NYN domain-containing protein [Novosphingobium taihuense]|nr:NYN domain-containing protein [Novosphingobium taihuense]